MSIKEEFKKLNDIQDAILALKTEASLVEQYIIKKYSGISPADVLECNRYTHVGKKICVDTIKLYDSFGEYYVIAAGNIIKKDGELSRNRGEHKKVIYERAKEKA